MTNEQLAVFLRMCACRLESEIEDLTGHFEAQDLDLKRLLEWRNKKTGRIAFSYLEKAQEPGDWEEVPVGAFICLEGLRNLLGQLDDMVEILEGK